MAGAPVRVELGEEVAEVVPCESSRTGRTEPEVVELAVRRLVAPSILDRVWERAELTEDEAEATAIAVEEVNADRAGCNAMGSCSTRWPTRRRRLPAPPRRTPKRSPTRPLSTILDAGRRRRTHRGTGAPLQNRAGPRARSPRTPRPQGRLRTPPRPSRRSRLHPLGDADLTDAPLQSPSAASSIRSITIVSFPG